MQTDILRFVLLTNAIILFIAILQMPGGYYDFLRIAVTVGALLAIISEFKNGFNGWIVAFAILAVLFNPIEPIYLYKKSAWFLIDLLGGLTFLLRGLKKDEITSN